MTFFMSDAMAAGLPASGVQSDGTFSLIMIAAIFILFYFMLIRPQNKRAKEHQALVSKIKKGDEIITTSGILAKVSGIDEQYIKAIIAEGIEVSFQRNAISSVLPKGTLKSL